MKSLFFKIFFAFTSTIILGAVLSFLVVGWLFPRKAWVDAWRDAARPNLRLAGIVGIRVYETRGPQALARFVRKLEGKKAFRVYFLDQNGQEITGRSLPLALRSPLQRSLLDIVRRKGWKTPLYHRVHVKGRDGKIYTLIQLVPPPPRLWKRTSALLISFAILLLAAMVLCFFLARHFFAPLRSLQAVTQRLSSGDLATRVDEGLRKRNDEFGKLARNFDHMAEQLQGLMEAHRRLLRDVSHELRSPLTRLGVALQLARDQCPVEIDVFLNRIEKETERLNDLIGQLLTLARLDQIGPWQKKEDVAFHQVVRDVLRDAAFEASEKGCHVQCSNLPEVTVVGSRRWLRSAVDNVVRNALRYAPASTSIWVHLQILHHQADVRTVLTVEDEGPGVPENELERLFLPFHRVDSDRDRKSGGTGLGLSIAKRVVRMHGGEIRASNRPQGGLRITIELPVKG